MVRVSHLSQLDLSAGRTDDDVGPTFEGVYLNSKVAHPFAEGTVRQENLVVPSSYSHNRFAMLSTTTSEQDWG